MTDTMAMANFPLIAVISRDGKINATVQTFNFYISRPDVCQCLVLQTSMDNMSKKMRQAH